MSDVSKYQKGRKVAGSEEHGARGNSSTPCSLLHAPCHKKTASRESEHADCGDRLERK
jgi:hypothetical protein